MSVHLPPDIMRIIMKYADLPVDTIIRLCAGNSHLNTILCKNDSFWYTLEYQRLGSDISTLTRQDIIKELRTIDELKTRGNKFPSIYADHVLEQGFERAALNFPEDSSYRQWIISKAHVYPYFTSKLFPLLNTWDFIYYLSDKLELVHLDSSFHETFQGVLPYIDVKDLPYMLREIFKIVGNNRFMKSAFTRILHTAIDTLGPYINKSDLEAILGEILDNPQQYDKNFVYEVERFALP